MTEGKKKAAVGRLCGRVVAIEILLAAYVVFVAAFACSTVLMAFRFMESVPVGVFAFMIVLGMVFAGLTFFMLEMLIAHFKQCGRMKAAYELLSEQEKTELLQLAASYRQKAGVCFNQTYVYGMIRQFYPDSKKRTYLPNFQYIRLNEISWIYKIEQSVAIANQDMGTSSTIRTPNEDMLRMVLYNGDCLQGKCRYTDLDTLFEIIRAQNPSCRVGYSINYY